MRVRLWGDQFDLYLRTYILGIDAISDLHYATLVGQPPEGIIKDPGKPRGWSEAWRPPG